MRPMSPILLMVALFLSPAAQEVDHHAGKHATSTAKAVAAAGRVFVKNCIGCHQVPDTRFAVDRAWLTRVADTT